MSATATLDLPNWLAQQRAKNAADGNLLTPPTPAAALPAWWNNPVGAERLNDTYASPASPDVSPVVGWYGQKPVTAASRANALDLASVMSQFGPADVGAIRAFHGSPADFHAFDIGKIGTGEGAQSYGHGLYFAGNEPTAAYYRDTLATRAPTQFNVGNDVVSEDALAERLRSGFGLPTNFAAKRLLSDVESGRNWDEIRASSPDKWGPVIDWLQGQKVTAQPRAEGKMYEVSLNADPEHFLDWDKPLSEQSVSAKLRGHLDKNRLDPTKTTGADIYRSLADEARFYGDKNPAASAATALHQRGIPGIKYLDQGSRNVQVLTPQQTTSGQWITKQVPNGNVLYRGDNEAAARAAGEGTSNYVIFDPKTIEILRKYGIAGLIGGATAASSQDQQ